MKFQMALDPKKTRILYFLVFGIFFLAGFLQYSGGNDSGDDLSASYVGCRLMSDGLAPAHLYKHDPTDFSAIGKDEAWQDEADKGNFIGFLHPYVQTPFWAFLLEPACTRTSFLTFKRIFAGLLLASFAGTVWLIARYWAPSLLHPFALGLVLLLLSLSRPFQYAMFLMQTHILFILMSVAGLILAERKKSGLAGFLLAFAATVKVTPILILLYWLITKKWRASAAMVGWLVFFSVASILASGLPLFRQYLVELSRLGHVLLLSQNNQSFAAFSMGHFYPAVEAEEINILPLPSVVRLLSAALMLGLTVAGAWFDRTRKHPAPLGAIIALLAATLFAPIAWTHYFILLLAPLMVLVDANVILRKWWIAALVFVILLLNLPPLSSDIIQGEVGRFAILRGQFLAGILSLLALLMLVRQQKASEASSDTT